MNLVNVVLKASLLVSLSVSAFANDETVSESIDDTSAFEILVPGERYVTGVEAKWIYMAMDEVEDSYIAAETPADEIKYFSRGVSDRIVSSMKEISDELHGDVIKNKTFHNKLIRREELIEELNLILAVDGSLTCNLFAYSDEHDQKFKADLFSCIINEKYKGMSGLEIAAEIKKDIVQVKASPKETKQAWWKNLFSW